MFLPFLIYKSRLSNNRSKSFNIEVHESNEWKDLIVPQRNSDDDENDVSILNRTKYSIELLHFLGLNSSVISSLDTYDDVILLFGSQTVIGTQIIKLVENPKNEKKTLVIKIRSFVDIDFTSHDISMLFDHLRSKITKAVIIYQPLYLFESAENDGSKRIEELISIELKSIQKFLKKMKIKPLFVIPPPHFKIYETVLINSTIIFVPNLIDTENIQDPKNLLNKIVFQCKMSHKSEIIYYKKDKTNDFISVLPVFKVAHFIYSNFIDDLPNTQIFKYINKTLLTSNKNDNEYSNEINIETSKQIIESIINNEFKINCQIDLKISPHEEIEFINYSTIQQFELSNPVKSEKEIKEKIHSSIENLFYFTDKPYLSIVFTGRNDDYGKGFIDRAKYFFYYLHKTIKELHNIVSIELIVVDYATEKSRNPLHSLFSDYLNQLNEESIFNDNNKIKIRFIQVPPEFHKKLINAKVPFLEYIAKNIGIRRANGEFVLSMNPDSLLSKNFFELVSNKFFNPGFLYTSTRIDMNEDDSESKKKKEKFIHRIFDEPKITSDNTPPNPFSKKHQTDLLHKSCYNNLEFIKINFEYRWGFGDFQMLSKKMWEAINGFNQFPTNTYVDNLLFAKMLKIRPGSFVMNLPTPIIHQYHTHVSSKRPHNIDIINNSMIKYEKFGRIGKEAENTDVDDWGFPDIEFLEVIYVI